LAAIHHVADGQSKDFGNSKSEEKLRAEERAIARLEAATMADEQALLARGKRT
jgi:hypothetical protein